MPSKSLLRWGFKKQAEDLAEKYRLELRISKFDPLCAFKLATHLDIPIYSVAQAFEGRESEPAFAVMNNPAKFSAMWMPNEDSEKRAGLQWALKNLGSEEKIAEYYTASIDMVKYRINTTGVLIQKNRSQR
jgi:hypothetical protein